MAGIAARRKSLKTRKPEPQAEPQAGRPKRTKSKGRAERRKPKSSEGQPAKAPPPTCDTPSGFREDEPNRRWLDQIGRKPTLLNSPSKNNRNKNLDSKTIIGENTEGFHTKMGRANIRRNLYPKRSPTHAALEKASEEEDSEGSGSICDQYTCTTHLRL